MINLGLLDLQVKTYLQIQEYCLKFFQNSNFHVVFGYIAFFGWFSIELLYNCFRGSIIASNIRMEGFCFKFSNASEEFQT